MDTTLSAQGLTPELLLDPAVIDEPYGFYRRLVAEAPVWRVPGTEVVLVSSFEAVTEATRRVEDFSSNLLALLYRNEDGTPGVMSFDPGVQALATADPPAHAGHRGAVFPELVARRMATLRGQVEDVTRDHLDRAFARPSMDAMRDLANPVPIRVVSKLIGFDDRDPDELLAAAFDTTAMLAATEPAAVIAGGLERSLGVISWIADQLQSAVDGGREGILGAVGAAVDAGELDLDAAFAIMATLLSAGGESTTGLVGNALHILAADGGLQARLRAEPELVTPFVEEVLRLESPFRYHLRHATRDAELQGMTVPAGATVLLLWSAANRDPAEFDRPDELLLDRPAPRHHLGFGRGIHLCVGAPLARLEADVILTRFLRRTERFGLDPDAPPARVNSLMVRRFSSLPLLVTPA